MPYRKGKVVNWQVKVKGIRPLLTDDNSDENAKETGKKVYQILTSQRYSRYFRDFEDLDEFLYLEGLDHFNDILDRLYDYCDDNLIWIDLD